MRNAIALLLAAVVVQAQAADRFAYDATVPLNVRQLASATGEGVRIDEIAYHGADGDVPATLVAPATAKGRGPAIVFLHWGLGDRHGWLDEAKLLAARGVVSLLIDAPFARPRTRGASPAADREVREIVQSVIDVRRGVDLLQARADVDRNRIGYAGLSFGTHVGAIVSSVEPRIRALVLLGGLASNAEEMKKGAVPAENREAHERAIAAMAELDAEKWIARPRTSAVFLQFAVHDEYISRAQGDRFIEAAGRAALAKWYEGAHELVRASRDDRLQWLAGHLGFSMNDPTYHAVAAEPSPGFAGTRYEELSRLGVVLEIPGMQHVRVRENVVYKRIGNQSLRFDAYYPFGVEHEPELRVPAIILVSGQAAPEVMPKIRGIRFVATAARAIAARANRVVIVHDIRSVLAPGARDDEQKAMPDVAADLDDLIRYLRQHGGELGIDGDSLAILARSAGGTYGLRAAWLGERPYIKAVSLQYTDVSGASLRGSGLEPKFLAEVATLDLARSPGRKAPLQLVTAEHDFFHDASAVAALKEALAANGTELEHIHLPNGDHGFDLVNDTEESRAAFLRTILFLRSHLPIRPQD
ncbi:MAG TPA: hypothetical protein VF432_03645 [Thermoanaerobaculia bacterium]